MSDLFHAGQARRTSGSITITMKNGKKLAKKLEKRFENHIKRAMK